MHRLAIIACVVAALFMAQESQAQTLTQSGPCPGVMTFEVTGATPFTRLAFIYSNNTGSWTIPPGLPCAGLTTLLAWPVSLATWEEADATGYGAITVFVPPGVCGTTWLQAVDTLSCTNTNVILVL